MTKKILITGGAGFIGSQVNWMLNQAGYETVVYDNLSTGDEKAVVKGKLIIGDLSDGEKLTAVLKNEKIDAVMHFAAFTDVGESVKDPAKYYQNNFINTVTLLESMRKAGVKNLIFSSSAAVYGLSSVAKIKENSPTEPINPYGETKLMIEKVLRDYRTAYGIKSCSLRYFNAAGGDPEGVLKHYKKKENNLIPIVLNAILHNSPVTVFGTDYETKDGTCIRDYIHVYDLGSAHILALEKLFNGNPSPCYNLGNGQGFSVKEVIETAEEVTGKKVKVIEGERREGDPPTLLADATLAGKELNWHPKFPELEKIISHAWKARGV